MANTERGMFTGTVAYNETLKTQVISLAHTNGKEILTEVGIAPEFGSNLFKFSVHGQEIIYTDPALLTDRDWTGCFVLWPYPNRIRNKEFEFEGQHISLKDIQRKKGNYPLIHGLVDDQVWEYGTPDSSSDRVQVKTWYSFTKDNPRFRFFPYESTITLAYILNAEGVKIEYTIENRSDRSLPFGFALHPYFSTLSGLDNTRVVLPAESVMSTDEELLPTGELQSVSGSKFDIRTPTSLRQLDFDHVFTDIHPGAHARLEYPDQHMNLHLETSEEFTHLVFYTMERQTGFVCLENQTGSTDMINLYTRGVKENNEALKKSAHLLILPSGQTHSGFIQYRIEQK